MCTENHDPATSSIMSVGRTWVIFHVTPKSLFSMLETQLGTTAFSPKIKITRYLSMTDDQRRALVRKLWPNQTPLPNNPPPYKTKLFPKWVQESISLFSLVLGREDYSNVDESMLAILELFRGPHNQVPAFRYA